MLFYFLMRTGNLYILNVDPLKVEVTYLKHLISNEINVNESNIILIANGGMCIQEGTLSTYYCADSEENPIFVYLRQQKRTDIEIIEDKELNTEFQNLKERLRIANNKIGSSLLILQENDTVSTLILEFCNKINKKIKLEIRNHFLLVEGWNAALANLYDSLASVEKRINAMEVNLEKFYSNGLDDGFEIMNKFEMSKAELENVPLLSSLIDDSSGVEQQSEKPVNLLQWILSQDSRIRHQITVQSIISEAHEAYHDLLGISDEAQTVLDSIKEQWGKTGLIADSYKNISIGKTLIDQGRPCQTVVDEDIEEIEKVTEKPKHTDTKDFLRRLEYLVEVRDQCDKLVSLIQSHKEYMNHTVRQCKESGSLTVLHDHCVSAKSQLENVNRYYCQLRENLHKVERSKNDLSNNIDCRKMWLQKFQTKLCAVDESLFFVKEKIKRVRSGLLILDQMHNAPLVYTKGITELVRRQHYLDFWYSWGSHCSKISQEIKRKDREAKILLEQDFENHFIQSLFSSLYSFSLPKLGTPLLQSVRPTLPVISEEDLNKLVEHLPQFRSNFKFDKIDIFNLATNFMSDDPVEEKSLKSFSKQISSNDLFDGISLIPVPDDTTSDESRAATDQIENRTVSDLPTSPHSPSSSSSKMVKSIESMDFQLTNDAATETRKDVFCISSSLLESLNHSVQELRLKLDITKSQFKRDLKEQTLSYKQIHHLSKELSDKSRLAADHLKLSSSSVNVRQTSITHQSTNTLLSENQSNMLIITHREFNYGDKVCFIGFMINNTLQWRMITSDDRIYFLNDSNSATQLISKKDEANDNFKVSDSASGTYSPPITGKISPKIIPINSFRMTMPIVSGTFLSKEEYMCKKSTNRYGLPINTKFFRVQANIDRISETSAFCEQ